MRSLMSSRLPRVVKHCIRLGTVNPRHLACHCGAPAHVKGEIPSPLDPPPGCHFHPRCPHAMARCREAVPPLVEIAPGRMSACWLNDATPRQETRTPESGGAR